MNARPHGFSTTLILINLPFCLCRRKVFLQSRNHLFLKGCLSAVCILLFTRSNQAKLRAQLNCFNSYGNIELKFSSYKVLTDRFIVKSRHFTYARAGRSGVDRYLGKCHGLKEHDVLIGRGLGFKSRPVHDAERRENSGSPAYNGSPLACYNLLCPASMKPKRFMSNHTSLSLSQGPVV